MSALVSLNRDVLRSLRSDIAATRLYILICEQAATKPQRHACGIELAQGQCILSVRNIIDALEYEEQGKTVRYGRSTVDRAIRVVVGTLYVTEQPTTFGTLFTVHKQRQTQRKLEIEHCRSGQGDGTLLGGEVGTPVPSCGKPVENPVEKSDALIFIGDIMTMRRKDAESLVREFGRECCAYYKNVCTDYLKQNGVRYKDYAAFMRNWIRREKARRSGYYAQDKYRLHVAASTFEKNLEYLRKKEQEEQHGTESAQIVLDYDIGGQKEPDII